MKDFVTYLVQSIVQNPEKIEVMVEEREDGMTVFNLKADSSDMGRLIGKEGKIIQAIRTLLRAAAYQKGKRVRLNILEDEIPEVKKVGDTKETVVVEEAESQETENKKKEEKKS